MIAMEMTERTESALLGSVLLAPKILDSIHVTGSHFADPRLGSLYELVRDMHDSGRAIDAVTLLAEVKRGQHDWTVGDIGELFDLVPNAQHAGYYAGIVIDSYRRRKLAALGERLAATAQDMTNDCTELIAMAENQLESLDASNDKHTISMADACEETYAAMFKATETERGEMLGTGFAVMDQHCGLWAGGEMIVLAARPACGKTSMAWQIVQHCGERGKPSLFASLEMGQDEIVRRGISTVTGVSNRELREGIKADDTDRVKRGLAELSEIDATLFVPPRSTLRQIRAAARMRQANGGLSLVVIDYLGLIRHEGRSHGKYEDTTETSQDIKAMARELAVPVLVLCQLNREAHGQTPKLSHLRDSGAIEQDADRVIFLEPHDWSPANRVMFNLIVAKNRGGQCLKTTMKFEGSRTRFLPPNHCSDF